MYVAAWSTARDRLPTEMWRLRVCAALGREGELDGGDEAADG
jgi:hypothetical protein